MGPLVQARDGHHVPGRGHGTEVVARAAGGLDGDLQRTQPVPRRRSAGTAPASRGPRRAAALRPRRVVAGPTSCSAAAYRSCSSSCSAVTDAGVEPRMSTSMPWRERIARTAWSRSAAARRARSSAAAERMAETMPRSATGQVAGGSSAQTIAARRSAGTACSARARATRATRPRRPPSALPETRPSPLRTLTGPSSSTSGESVGTRPLRRPVRESRTLPRRPGRGARLLGCARRVTAGSGLSQAGTPPPAAPYRTSSPRSSRRSGTGSSRPASRRRRRRRRWPRRPS